MPKNSHFSSDAYRRFFSNAHLHHTTMTNHHSHRNPEAVAEVNAMHKAVAIREARNLVVFTSRKIYGSMSLADKVLIPFVALVYLVTLVPLLVVRPGRTAVVLYLHVQDVLKKVKSDYPRVSLLLTHLSHVDSAIKEMK